MVAILEKRSFKDFDWLVAVLAWQSSGLGCGRFITPNQMKLTGQSKS
jgi:hypothetical protein